MSEIKFGLKLWSNDSVLLGQAQKLIDGGVFQYVELMAVPGDDVSAFEKTKIPYILHIPHDSFGFNIADSNSLELSHKILQENIKLADIISAKYLILHCGVGQIEIAKAFLEKIYDRRILIENMPIGPNHKNMIGYNIEQLKELQKNKFGFCLDFGHAIKAAVSLRADWAEFIRELLTLEPKIFHISDGIFSEDPDEHLNIGEGKYDFKFFLDCIKISDSKFVTLETPKAGNSLANDIENLKRIKKYLKY